MTNFLTNAKKRKSEIRLKKNLLPNPLKMAKPSYPTHIPKDLIDSYLATEYWVSTQPPFCIKVQEENNYLFDFLEKNKYQSWGFITAWNPYSQEKSLEENNHQNLLLEKEIIGHSFDYFPAEGRLGEWLEKSFFVLGISREEVVLLGKKFGQNAVLFGNLEEVELVFCV
ncbi:MAG: hypothetical protein ACI94Y_002908 [Maribacter sp.]